jgi:probable rRNA maturation factor
MAPGDQRSRLLVTVTDEHGRARSAALARWLASAAPRRAGGAVNVALVSDARVRALNRHYRGQDYATDVLSFPASHDQPHRPRNTPRTHLGAIRRRRRLGSDGDVRSASSARSAVDRSTRDLPFLGEIVIARGVARRQARRAGHAERTEWRVLALHGLLHLLGYDHEADRGEMRRLESRLRRRAGLRGGLIERADGRHAR